MCGISGGPFSILLTAYSLGVFDLRRSNTEMLFGMPAWPFYVSKSFSSRIGNWRTRIPVA
jgi:hypothetical protein